MTLANGVKILFGFFFLALAGALLLAGSGAIAFSTPSQPTAPVAALSGGVQELRMTVTQTGYSPDYFVVRQGVPVKFIIDGTNARGCSGYIMSQEFGFGQRLQPGENIIQFTPARKGTYGFSCSMGMYRGTIVVIGDGEQAPAQAPAAQAAPRGGSCGAGGGCGCGGV